MKEPATKAELLQAINTSRKEWDDLVARIPFERLSEPLTPGGWSSKDIVAHITEYDRHLALGLALRLQKPPQLWLDDLGLDEFNARLHEKLAGREPGDILLDSLQVFWEIICEVKSHSEEYLFGTHRVEGVSYDIIPYQMLKSESYGHYRDHIPAVRNWITTTLHK
jgi:Protein of unknown function (DUF1706)